MSEQKNPKDHLNEVKALRDKANLLASMHSMMCDHYEFWHSMSNSVILVLSTLMVGLTFISEDFVQQSIGLNPLAFKWISGLISILLFCSVLVTSELNFNKKAAAHREATRFYFQIINNIRELINSGNEITTEITEHFYQEYSRTNALPKIPEKKFLRLKQNHLQKVAISRTLDSSPFEPIKDIRKRLGTKVD